MGSMSVSLCICCMFVSCGHPLAVLNAAFCMACSLLMQVEDTRVDHMEEEYWLQTTQTTSGGSCHSGLKLLCKLCRTSPPIQVRQL